jgi:uncharacterized protein
MPRKLIKRLSRLIHQRRHRWYLSIFGDRLTDPHLWSLNRHSITAAFGVSIAVSFIPLPVHLELVVLAAIWWRLNVAVAVATSYFFVNPFTMVPVYFAAYRVGAVLLRYRPRHFVFHLTWNWLEHGLGPAWKPFLVGCLVCGVGCGLIARFTLELVWREVSMRRYRSRQRLRERERERNGTTPHAISRP